MLCDPPPANEEILPEVGQGSYFFNRIGQKQTVISCNYLHFIFHQMARFASDMA